MQTRLIIQVEHTLGVPLEQLTAVLSRVLEQVVQNPEGFQYAYKRLGALQVLQATGLLEVDGIDGEPTPMPAEPAEDVKGDLSWN